MNKLLISLLALVFTPLAMSQQKVKIKHGEVTVRDKSKPVRAALEAWYQRNMAAFAAKDVPAIMALRTADFHTVTPDGKTNTRADMEARTIGFLRGIDHFISQKNEIGTIELDPVIDGVRCLPCASADVHQHVVRIARLPDGTLHKIESWVTQRETWKNAAEGWKLYRVDNIRDNRVLVDDKPREPNPK